MSVALAAGGGAIAALGLALMLAGALGALRFPDFFTRLHAAALADGAGALVVVLGLAVVAAGDAATALRLLLLAGLLALQAPILAQLAANAAHADGLAPLTGRYRAPRPGAAKERA